MRAVCLLKRFCKSNGGNFPLLTWRCQVLCINFFARKAGDRAFCDFWNFFEFWKAKRSFQILEISLAAIGPASRLGQSNCRATAVSTKRFQHRESCSTHQAGVATESRRSDDGGPVLVFTLGTSAEDNGSLFEFAK